MKQNKCKHKRKKKIYSHGRNSPSLLVCKDCGVVLKKKDMKDEKKKR